MLQVEAIPEDPEKTLEKLGVEVDQGEAVKPSQPGPVEHVEDSEDGAEKTMQAESAPDEAGESGPPADADDVKMGDGNEAEQMRLSIPAEWVMVLLFAMEIRLGFKDEDNMSELLNIDFFRDKRLFEKFFKKKSKYKFEPAPKTSESGDAPGPVGLLEPEQSKFRLENDINHQKGNIFDVFSKETHLIINQFVQFTRKHAQSGIEGHHLVIAESDFSLLEFLMKFANENKLEKEVISGLDKFKILTENVLKGEDIDSQKKFFKKDRNFGKKYYKRRKYK